MNEIIAIYTPYTLYTIMPALSINHTFFFFEIVCNVPTCLWTNSVERVKQEDVVQIGLRGMLKIRQALENLYWQNLFIASD